ncbi:MAG: gamma-glutamyl-gamma-aminobutyrate hydrolase family protein [Rhodothermales bacterium]|nr:gamma-glutamyl-gamma-aminobutyrate hydrolase family protein [Rhodothermales bacterium]MBO6780427.1 gamma-glutamyl-gamma-aminobutyrate hydrolase family protein [Rhodothermales bacterium]
MKRPLIGITTSLKDGKQELDARYADAVEAAGGIPVVLPTTTDPGVAEALVDLVQGLVITGGPAIQEGLIGSLPDDIKPTDARRSASDRLYLELHRRRSAPVLGICYGMQLINAVAGGTIHADVQSALEGTGVHSSERGGTSHAFTAEPDTWIAKLLGEEPRSVNTYHIQALASVGQGFRVAGRADDGVIEAIENEDGSVLGVQFHPERQVTDLLPLFKHLVARAADRS